jgi:long-chain fatty acid transport protein
MWCGVAALLMGVPNAYAGGIEVPDLGAVALGRGTAFVAKADNLTAFYYNPAGLSKSKGPNLIMGANLGNLNVDYRRTGGEPVEVYRYDPPGGGGPITVDAYHPDQDYYDYYGDGATPYSSQSQQGAMGISSANLVFNWGDPGGIKGLAVAVGVITPSGYGSSKYPKSGSQRYVLGHAEQLIVYPGVGISYAVNRYFQVGAVFLVGLADLKFTKSARFLAEIDDSPPYNEHREGDAIFDIHTQDMFMPTGIIGILSNPTDWLEIGVSLKLPTFIKSSGTAEMAEPPDDNPDSVVKEGQDEIGIDLTLPMVVRAGLRYIHRVFDIEVDFVWENWSVLDEIKISSDLWIESETADINTGFPDSVVPLKYRDTYSVRLGSDINVWPEHMVIRAGAYWQSSAYPEDNRTFSVFAPFGQQVGLGGGLTWRTSKWLDVNVAYLHVFQQDVTIEQGVVQQMALPRQLPDPDDPTESEWVENGNIVNSGKYDVNMNIIGLSLEGHF